MITTLPPESARSTKPTRPFVGLDSKASAALAPDYRLLGLRPREARVEVIREALHSAASQVQLENAARTLVSGEASIADSSERASSDRGASERDEQRLSQIAVAGYRLLDPRRRRTLYERVQLLMTTEEEWDAALESTWASRPVAPPKLKIALKASTNSSRPMVSASASTRHHEENQVALELFRDMRQRDRRALALWIGLASLTVSLATTLALFAYLA